MNLRKITAFSLAALLSVSVFSGCDTVERMDISESSQQDTFSSIAETGAASEPETEPEPAESYPEYNISYPEIEQQDTGDIYEAENCMINGLQTASTRTNYSGECYVTGFSSTGANSIVFEADIPSNQHYDLSFSIASDSVEECTVMLNGSEISSFKTTDDGVFTLITLQGVFMVKGKSEILLRTNGNIDLDYLKISNNTTLSEISYDADGQLSNQNAAESAAELMSFLSESYGKYIITGQYVSDETDSELELIYRTTGKYPAIRFAALHNSQGSFSDGYKVINAAADWYQKGGIVGLMWYWETPGDKPSVYAEETDFKLSDAVTDIELAELSQEEIRGLYGEGKISEECYGLILDIDNISGQLLSLKNKGIPVLWRPLHEASGGWYWWGASGSSAYNWLWELMYQRMTKYFGLDNLIWVWNGQSEEYMVDKSTFDIASADLYIGDGKDYGSRYEQFVALQKIVGSDKLVALSECSSIPDIDAVFRDNAVWSFFGLWYGDYIQTDDGKLSEKYTSKESFVRMYNSSGALTLDKYIAIKNGEAEIPTAVATEITTDE